MHRLRRAVAFVLPAVFMAGALATAACSSSDRPQGPAQSHGAARPADRSRPGKASAPAGSGVRLIVLVIVDQLPSWAFEAALPSLEGGLGRLAREGVHYARAEIPYAGTFTASGHAALATGAPPSVTGILANEWHRATGDDPVGSTIDPDDPQLRSSRQLRVDGVADVLEEKTGGKSHTIALGLKDRSAILAIGRRPDLAVWYDSSRGVMTTNRFYAAATPGWLDTLTRAQPPSRYFTAEWKPRDPALVAQLAGGGDDQPGERGNDGLDATFPHSLAGLPTAAAAIINTPMGTAILFETAEAALAGESLGQDDVPDLLSISVSSHDYAGHGWGLESWERIDVMLDLDRRLGAFMERLDSQIGAGRYAVVLSSDHGGTRLVERLQAAGMPARRVLKVEIVAAAERAADRVLGRGTWTRAVSGNLLHVTAAFDSQPAARRKRALSAMVKAISLVRGMGLVAPTAELRGDCTKAADPMRQLACRSLPDTHLGPIVTLSADGSQIAGGHPWGGGHGGPSADERTVPILVFAPGRAPRRVDTPVSLLRVAPTLSALAGIPAPPSATEPPLD